MGLNEIVDAFTTQIQEERSKENRWNPLRPSSAGKCARQLAHEYMEFKGYATTEGEVKPPAVARLLDLGSSIEYHANEQMRRAFAKSGTPIKMKYKQQSVSICRLHDNSLIEGNIDLWIETEQWRCMADWKSKGDKYSQFYKSSWDEFVEKLVATGFATKFGSDAVFITDLEKFIAKSPDVFFNDNLYQLNIYGTTDFAKERNITFCSVLQYNKNDSRIREVRFTPTQAVADKTIAKYQHVAKEVDTTKSVEGVDKEYQLGSMRCGFCERRKNCWPENDALKDYFKTLPKKHWAKDLDRLPLNVQQELVPLFAEYEAAVAAGSVVKSLEEKIIKVLDRAKVFKVKFREDAIYRVKKLASGGPGDGARHVLRRDKN